MGLDMWVLKVSKPNETELKAIKTIEDLYNKGFSAVKKFYVDKEPAGYEGLTDFSILVDIDMSYLDMDKIKKDFKFERITYKEQNQNGIIFNIDDGREIRLTTEQIESTYKVVVAEPHYVFVTKDVAYWRKEYGIQEIFYSAYPDIINCGYTLIDEDVLDEVNAEFDADVSIPKLEDGEALFYHEWY